MGIHEAQRLDKLSGAHPQLESGYPCTNSTFKPAPSCNSHRHRQVLRVASDTTWEIHTWRRIAYLASTWAATLHACIVNERVYMYYWQNNLRTRHQSFSKHSLPRIFAGTNHALQCCAYATPLLVRDQRSYKPHESSSTSNIRSFDDHTFVMRSFVRHSVQVVHKESVKAPAPERPLDRPWQCPKRSCSIPLGCPYALLSTPCQFPSSTYFKGHGRHRSHPRLTNP